jgi:putative membrane protein (TIGR04086 family)
MHGDVRSGAGFDGLAVGAGIVWGLMIVVLGGLAQGIASGLGFSPSAGTELVMTLLWHGIGAFVGGFLAARRAGGMGWLHGALSGAALVLSIAAVMGVREALPELAALLKFAGLGTGAGVLGGMLGVGSAAPR